MKVLINIAHSEDTPGKCSPDRSFREWEYSEEICTRVYEELKSYGFSAELIRQDTYNGPSQGLKQVVDDVNRICKKEDCILISIHVNAAGNGDKWYEATGWSAYTSKGTTKSDGLADDLYWAAEQTLKDKKIRKDISDGDKDLESDFYILKKTRCPAVLTENFFMDCKKDLEYLTSEEGKSDITKVHVDGILAYLQKQ